MERVVLHLPVRVSPVHVSGEGSEDFYQEIGKLPVVEGRFHLSPHWRRDYVAETHRILED